MALNKLKFNSLNVTPTAGKTIGFNSSADGLEATFSGGAMTFIKKLTASSSSSLTFTNGSSDVILDSTYKEYVFIYQDIHPSANGPNFQVQFNCKGFGLVHQGIYKDLEVAKFAVVILYLFMNFS